MALFKIKRGLKANLPTTYNEGYCYVTTDDGKFYIDTSNAASGRIVLNAEHADTATTLSTTRYIDGIAFNGDNNVSRYGTCSTAAATVAKTVTLGGGAFSLTTGARVLVKFTVTNTAASPTLNVNGTGAKAIRYRGSAISKGYLAATRVYEFVYDGTAWELIGDVNTNTTYSAATASKLGLIKVGNGLSINTDGVLSHADTNGSVSNLTAASRTYVTSLTFDEYGHVTGYNVGTETVTNTDTHHTAYIYLGNSTATSNATSAVTDPYINLIENGSKRSGIQFKAGSGITVSGVNGIVTISHADNSSVQNLTANGRTYVTGLTFDAFGHVTGYSVGSETVTNTHHTAYVRLGSSTATANATTAVSDPYIVLVENGANRSGVQLKAGSGITISGVNGIATISHADNSAVQNLTASGRRYVTGLTFDAFGHVTAYTTGTETITDTHYTTAIKVGASGTNSNSEATNPYIKVLDNTTYRSQIQLAGSGLTTVTSNASGKVTIDTTINGTAVTTALGYVPDTPAQVDAKVAALVDSAPSTLNTLNELAAALGDDANFATTVATNIGKKVAKAGDTMTGHLDGINVSTSWIQSIRKGAFRLETAAHSSGAAAVISMKTSTGAWSIANLTGSNNLYFVYGTDDNYSAGTNATSNFYISTDGTYSGAASKLTLSDKGTSTKPIYLVKGVATECSTYAGGTAVTLNGSSKAASTASFYAPISGGTSGYILKSNGTGAPTWLQTLPVANGGTGNTAMTANRLVWSESASKLTAGYHYASSTKVAINSTSAPTETFYVNGTAKINGALTATSLNLTSFAKTLTLSAANTWTDTGISGSNLTTGTYIIQIERGGEYFSGVMSWTTGKDTSPSATEGYDEIVLHNAGSIAGSTSHIMARTVRTTSGIKLQICGNMAMASATVNIKCAKII